MGEKLLNWLLAMLARAWALLAICSILALVGFGVLSLGFGFITEWFPSPEVADLWERRLLFGGLIGGAVAVAIVCIIYFFVRPKPHEMIQTTAEIVSFKQRGDWGVMGGGVEGIPVEIHFSFQTENGETVYGSGKTHMTTQELVNLTIGTSIPISYYEPNPRVTEVPKQFGGF